MSNKIEALLKSVFAVDSEGNTFIRIASDEPKGELANAANSHSHRNLETLLASSIVLDLNGNPAIRLAVVDFGSTVEEANKKRREKMLSDKKKREEKAEKLRLKLKKEAEES